MRRTLTLIGIVLAFRLLYAAFFAINPAGDEAYYWDWGRQLDIGYYSKPPFVAWLYAFVDWIGGGSLFAIRATSAILGAGSLYVLFRLLCSLFDDKTAWVGVLLAITAPANSVLSFFLTIDAPLILCWSTALWMFWRYVNGESAGGSLFFLFLALAIGHLSKQMMMIFPILAGLFLALDAETRPRLKDSKLLLTLFGSYLSLVPPLAWNAKNDWITFQHTQHHFEAPEDGGNVFLDRGEDFLSFLGTQLGVLGPVTAVIVFSVALVSLPTLRKSSLPIRFLLIFGALPLALMLLLALRQVLQPNWPAVFYVSGIGLAAAWYRGHITPSFPPQAWRRLFPVALALSIALTTYFYLGSPLLAVLGKEGHTADPNRRLMGHGEVAMQFERTRSQLENPGSVFLVALGHRDVASHLAFGLPDQPRVYR
ncbi:MAG: glycosyltransferase family 39 protein, partial [Verrucomicrobiota bacterium]